MLVFFLFHHFQDYLHWAAAPTSQGEPSVFPWSVGFVVIVGGNYLFLTPFWRLKGLIGIKGYPSNQTGWPFLATFVLKTWYQTLCDCLKLTPEETHSPVCVILGRLFRKVLSLQLIHSFWLDILGVGVPTNKCHMGDCYWIHSSHREREKSKGIIC